MAYLSARPAQLAADHPLEATVAASAVASEVLLLRLASGLRWAGDLRPALALSRVTWSGAEGELVGARASWQAYGSMSLKEAALVARNRVGFDLFAQGGANYIDSNEVGIDRPIDALLGINLIESGMAVYGLKPFGIGVGSAFLQYSVRDGWQTPLNRQLSWTAFGAQATIGTVSGLVGERLNTTLSRRLAYRLYQHTALRMGHDAAYPVWLGSNHLFRMVVPAGLGVLEEWGENQAANQWKSPAELAADRLLQAQP